MNRITLEICCGSAEDVFTAARAGADRVELNSALLLGGLTPSLGTVRVAKEAGIPIMAMVRPRDGGFCYSGTEFRSMLAEVQALAAEGVDGLVFGVLNPNGTVDMPRNRMLMDCAGAREIVFHRAIDVTPDWKEALNALVELGFTRVLTSGQAASAPEGADTICEMVEYAAGRIEILPGGGIRPENAAALLAATGCRQLHASCSGYRYDRSCNFNPAVSFRGSSAIPDEAYTAADGNKVRALLSAIGR